MTHEVYLVCPVCDAESIYCLPEADRPTQLPCLARNTTCAHTFDTQAIEDAYASQVNNP